MNKSTPPDAGARATPSDRNHGIVVKPGKQPGSRNGRILNYKFQRYGSKVRRASRSLLAFVTKGHVHMIELLKEFMGLPLKNKILTAPFYAFVFSPGHRDQPAESITGMTRLYGTNQPQQPINGVCRRLAGKKLIVRRDRQDGILGNYLVNDASSEPPTQVAEPEDQQSLEPSEDGLSTC
jgi:hypothetical protein